MDKKLRALIIGDSKDDVHFLLKHFKKNRYTVDYQHVDNGPAYKEALQGEDWDFVLSDYAMSNFSVKEALKIFHENGKDIPFIVVSGAVGEDTTAEVLRQGAHDYIRKANLSRLIPALEREIRDAGIRREKKTADDRIKHLVSTLEAIRNVNQLIIRVKDPHRLIQTACDNLTATRGYLSAWIALSDGPTGVSASAYAGWDGEIKAFLEDIRRGKLCECGERALKNGDAIVVHDALDECKNCVLADSYGGKITITAPLLHVNRYFGLISASLPEHIQPGEEEIGLFQEVTSDLAYALYNIEVERTQAKTVESLQSSEEFNRRIIESSNDCIKILDMDGKITFISDGGRKLREIDDVSSVLNKSWIDFWKGDDQQAAISVINAAKEGEVGRFQGYNPTAKGTPRWWDVSITPIKGAKGRIVSLLAISRDITERKQNEEELKKLAMIAEQAAEGIAVADLDGTMQYANKAWADMHGCPTPDELIGKHLSMFHSEEQLQKEVIEFNEEVKRKGHHRGEVGHIRSDGTLFPTEMTSTLYRNKSGEPIGLIGFATDITDRKRAEENLKQYTHELDIRNRIAEVFVTVPDEDIYAEVLNIILECMESKYGTFGYINENGDLAIPTMTRTIWNKCQVTEKTFLFRRDSWIDSVSSWPTAIREKRTIYSNEFSKITPEGHITITRHISLPIIYKDNVVGLLQVANKETDYTEEDVNLLTTIGNVVAPILDERLRRLRTEVVRKRLLTDLKRSNQELEQFAYVVSHDLQEPLRMISSFTQLLERRYKDKLDKDAIDFIDFAVDGSNRMQKLINDLLQYSRVTMRGKEFKEVDAHSVLGQAINNLQQSIVEAGAIVTNDDLPVIKVDESQFERVFQNLIDNAIKFRREEAHPNIHISVQEKGPEWLFSLHDNGIGIDMQYKERIFTIFQRLHSKKDYPGTGIGLSICKRIIQRHDGSIWFESEQGKGTTFYFTIPK